MDRIVVILPTWPVQTEALGDVMGAIGVITSSGGTDKRRRMEGGSAGDFMACGVNPVEQCCTTFWQRTVLEGGC